MALAIASLSSGSGNDLTTLTLTAPTGIQVGDLLLAIVHESRRSTVTPTIPGFTLAIRQGTGGTSWSLHEVTVFYKVAESADTSATDYTITYGTQYGGAAVLYRLSDWGGNTENPILNSFGFNDSTSYASNTFSYSITSPRPNNGIAFMVGARNVDDTSIGPANHSAYAITSTDGDLTWTENLDTNYQDTDNNYSIVGIASAPSTATSDITNFQYNYNRGSSLTTTIGTQISLFFFIAEPKNETGNNTFVEFKPEFFTNATSLGATGAATFVEVEPVVIANSKPYQPSTSWSNQSKSTTTWTNQSKT